MQEAFAPDVLDAFARAQIDFLKLGPSATVFEQAWDAGTLFRDAKTGLAAIFRNKVDVFSERLRRGLEDFFSEFATAFTSIPGILSAEYKEKITVALESICHCLGRYFSRDKMVRSFQTVGQHIPLVAPRVAPRGGVVPPSPPADTVDFEVMLRKCSSLDITPEEYRHLLDCAPACKQYGLEHGQYVCSVSVC